MADLSLVTDNYFTIASETFADNLSASIAAGAATVPVNNNSEYTNDDCVVLTVDPGTVNEATFIGKKSGLNFIECIWTEGNTAVGHSNGATIIDYDSATHHNAQSKGILEFANPDGTLQTQPVRDALGLGASATNGWEVLPNTLSVTTGYNKGNKEFDITVANADVTSFLSVGMKLRLARGTTAPTMCTDLESGSSQYASRASGSVTGITFTDDFTAEAWVKLESYQNNSTAILARHNVNGFIFYVNATGQVAMQCTGGGVADSVNSHISLFLDEWTHVACSMDMSGTSGLVYFNGVSVGVTYTNSAATSFTQAGDLMIGNYTGAGNTFDGKISDVRLWNVVRTQTQIRDNMYQQLVGTETNLVGYWKLNGDFNDSTTNANHLTASGGAVATNVDHIMKSTEYAIIQKIAYGAPNTTITVFTGTEHGIPNMTLSSPYYSVQESPYGFPTAKAKWSTGVLMRSQASNTAPTVSVWYNLSGANTNGGFWLQVPTGEFDLSYMANIQANGASPLVPQATLSTANNTEIDRKWTSYTEASGTVSSVSGQASKEYGVNNTTATPWYLNIRFFSAGATAIYNRGDTAGTYIRAVSAHI